MRDWIKTPCETCHGTGKLKGTRAGPGRCGTRRGTTLKNCGECWGKGYIETVKPLREARRTEPRETDEEREARKERERSEARRDPRQRSMF